LKAKVKKVSKPKSGSSAQEAYEYEKVMDKIDKKGLTLDKKVRFSIPNSIATTSDTYAEAMVKFTKDVEKISEDDVALAFDLMLEIGARSRASNMDHGFKMDGFGESEGPYKEMDDVMVELIEKRKLEGMGDGGDESIEIRGLWTRKDAEDVTGPFKTGHPNKQQRGQLERHKMKWDTESRVATVWALFSWNWRSMRNTSQPTGWRTISFGVGRC
jgi:hypothetical protein